MTSTTASKVAQTCIPPSNEKGYMSIGLHMNRLNQVATNASLIAGFCFSALTALQDDPTQPYNNLIPPFTVLCSLAIGCNILTVTILTLMNVTIPSARVHPEGISRFYCLTEEDQSSINAMNRKMKVDYYLSVVSFILGLFAFVGTMIMILFVKMVKIYSFINDSKARKRSNSLISIHHIASFFYRIDIHYSTCSYQLWKLYRFSTELGKVITLLYSVLILLECTKKTL